MKFVSRPRRVILSGIIASALCAGGFGGYSIAHPGTAFAWSCPDPPQGQGSLGQATVIVNSYCTSNTIIGNLNGAPGSATNLGINLYQGAVGHGTLVAKNGQNPTVVSTTTSPCNNYYYAYAAYTYNGQRYGANTTAIFVNC